MFYFDEMLVSASGKRNIGLTVSVGTIYIDFKKVVPRITLPIRITCKLLLDSKVIVFSEVQLEYSKIALDLSKEISAAINQRPEFFFADPTENRKIIGAFADDFREYFGNYIGKIEVSVPGR